VKEEHRERRTKDEEFEGKRDYRERRAERGEVREKRWKRRGGEEDEGRGGRRLPW
jgi:hypothetical protein